MTSKSNPKKFISPKFTLVITLTLFTTLIYFLTSAGNTPHNYFVYLADAFLHQKYWLTNPPPWLNELIPAPQGKFYVVYPPMPAVLLIPFVLLFSVNFPQQYLAHLLGTGITTLTFLLSYQLKKDLRLALWSSLLAGFGTIIWFLSSVGSAWYLGQLSACFFLTAALVESLAKKRPFLIGLLLGAAYLSRLPTILSLPLFLYLLKNKFKKPSLFIFFTLPILTAILANSYYNFIRFGVLWDKAYLLIPGLLEEPWYQKGLFHPSYLPRHLKTIFWSFPKFSSHPPFLTPSWAGLAIWITTPAFLYSLFAPFKKRLIQVCWLSIFLISIPIFTHGTTGFTQFGYRFAVDFYPLLIFLTIKAVSKTNLKYHHWFLLFFSILVNLWGVLFINKLGLVSY